VTSDEAPEQPARRSRRSLLTAAAAAGGALAASALGRVPAASAANGDGLKVGQLHTGTAVTEVRNTAAASNAVGLKGFVTTTVSGGSTAGVWGQSSAQNGNGVFGFASNTGSSTKGVWGRSVNGRGVFGEATGGGVGVVGTASGTGVHGQGYYGLRGVGDFAGVRGEGASIGVSAQGDNTGVSGRGVTGVFGEGSIYGMDALGGEVGVRGRTNSTTQQAWGVWGQVESTIGTAVYGRANSPTGSGTGVAGVSLSDGGYGVFGLNRGSGGWRIGVYGDAYPGYAGLFKGTVFVEGTLNKSGGSFVIDHPQDPANKTLEHSFVEAPERLNVYRGNVTLDANGRATVRMPGYFKALNVDYSYQLTPMGAPAPELHVASGIARGSFRIAGGAPSQQVCWQVTGVRQDAWAQKHPLRVERAKKRKDRGKYLNPEAFGKPRSEAIHQAPKVPKMRRPRRVRPAA
jgi:hypothetical protein